MMNMLRRKRGKCLRKPLLGNFTNRCISFCINGVKVNYFRFSVLLATLGVGDQMRFFFFFFLPLIVSSHTYLKLESTKGVDIRIFIERKGREVEMLCFEFRTLGQHGVSEGSLFVLCIPTLLFYSVLALDVLLALFRTGHYTITTTILHLGMKYFQQHNVTL